MENTEENRIKITEDALYENGYQLKGLQYFVNIEKNITVKLVTTSTGKYFFSNNTRGVKYFDQLCPGTEGRKIQAPEKFKQLLSDPEIRIKALKGDALISFFSRELLCNSSNVFLKGEQARESNKIVSNEYLREVCISLDIHPSAKKSAPSYGTMYEAKVYEVYLESGFDKAFDYFKETVFKYYKETII